MATENLMRVAATGGIKGGISSNENLRSSGSSTGTDTVAQELGMLLRGQSRVDSNLNWKGGAPNRSGSAPPTVEGSFASLGGLFSSGGRIESDEIADVVDSEQGLRSDPSYLAYYYSHVNLNPRLPPPIISRENYILAQRLANANLSDKRKVTSFDDNNRRSLFSAHPMLPTHKEENEYPEDEKSSVGLLLRQMSDRYSSNGGDSLLGSELHGSGARPKSLVDLIQQDFPRTPSPVYSQQRPSSRLANDELTDAASVRDSSAATLNTRMVSSTAEFNSLHGTYKSSGVRPVISSPLATSVGNSSFPESSESGLAMTQGKGCSSTNESCDEGDADLSLSLQELRLSSRQGVMSSEHHDPAEPKQLPQGTQEQSQMFENRPIQPPNLKPQGSHSQSSVPQSQTVTYGHQHQHQVSGLHQNYTQGKYGPNSRVQHGSPANVYAAAAAAAMSYVASGSPYYSGGNMYMPHYGMGGYGVNPSLLPGVMSNYSSPLSYENTASGISARTPPSNSMGTDVQQMYKYTNPAGAPLQSRLSDPLYLHYLQQQTVEDARSSATVNDSILRAYLNGSHGDPLDLHKSQLSSLMLGYSADPKSQFLRNGIQSGSQSGTLSPIYYGSPPNLGFAMPYTNSPISSPILPGSPVIPGSLSSRHSSRSSAAAAYAGWQGPRSSDLAEDFKCSTLLEELKSSKSRGFELTDIAGHVVEFSADQHGSRFIQQKLETASIEEKNLVFQEILPKALTLMTDVFGNYVIQKFFDHGSMEQRSELANQLIGHVLNLSLQMYGCRVIQKALEVISTEQQIRIVAELNGHVMKCVRDQNGNHVIQKCIECVPSEHIEFIISAFHDHVIMLSTHPYGCRVIQRVLEHCTDEQKQGSIMADILHSVCSLAQDQYGNYVVQHVLEHGKPHEKNEIMTKLAGQFVPMSQHKFASNVVEKCLEFGGAKERQIMITEMLGDTDENEPLQAMMKDQYANYVVQKVLETCSDQQRELLLSRIRVHLHALKKYTYGKHIVARVEKLLTAGERRGTQTSA